MALKSASEITKKKHRERQLAWSHTPEGRAYRKKYREGHQHDKWTYRLRVDYGLTADQYKLILDQQHGVCAICKEAPKKTKLAVDHCHRSGRIRGLLCSNCNRALGHLHDSEDNIERLLKYVKNA